MFALIVNNFTIQYVGNAHLDHLCQALKKHYKVSEEIDDTRFASMTFKWNYSPIHAECSCCHARLYLQHLHQLQSSHAHQVPTLSSQTP
jgi:hypothetical protein